MTRGAIRGASCALGVTYTLGSRHHCGYIGESEVVTVTMDASGVNWSCNATLTDTGTVSYNISGDYEWKKVNGGKTRAPLFSTLAVVTECDKLTFTGGLLNRQRSMIAPPLAMRDSLCEVEIPGPTQPQAQQITRVEVIPQLNIEPSLEEVIDGELTAKENARILRDAPLLLYPKALDPSTLDPLTLPLDPIWYPGDLMPGINAILELIWRARPQSSPDRCYPGKFQK